MEKVHNACGSHYFKVVSDPNDGCPHLVKVARQGTTALVDFLLETGADLEESDRLKCKLFYGKYAPFFSYRFGNTALMAAASNGHLQVVQRLIRVGANVAASCQVVFIALDNVVDDDDDGLATHSHHYK